MKEIKISIIVPVYNVEKYISKCLDSLINQTFSNLEIVIVNDGSTDNSRDICIQYQKRDSRIKLIDQKNQGVSMARNTGLLNASGNFIGFVDPDDWVELDMYERLLDEILQHDSDVAISNIVVDETGKPSRKIKIETSSDLLADENMILNELVLNMIGAKDFSKNTIPIMGSVCRLLISKKLINEELFEKDINFMEDLIFCIKIFLRSNKISISNGYFYHYVYRNNSAVRSFKKNYYEQHITVFDKLVEIFKLNSLNYTDFIQFEVRKINIFLNTIFNELGTENKITFKAKIKQVKSIVYTCSQLDFKYKEQILSNANRKNKYLLNSLFSNRYKSLFAYYYIFLCLQNIKKRYL